MRNQPTPRPQAIQAGSAVREARAAQPDRPRKVTPLLAMVLDAARRKCEDFDDGPEARAQMKREVLATPPALLPDLLQALSVLRIRRADLVPPAASSSPFPTPKEPTR